MVLTPTSPYCPTPVPYNTGHGTLPDATVGSKPDGFLGLFRSPVNGYGLDLNNTGRYEAGQDGVLAFDFNKDGNVDNREIDESRQMMKALDGSYNKNDDPHNKGICGIRKDRRGELLQRAQQMGLQPGQPLSNYQLAAAGGRVLVDQDRNGSFSANEQFSPHSFPSQQGAYGRGSLNYLDPQSRFASVNQGWGWALPPCRCW